MSLKTHIDTDKLPNHVAIIMDGNGRWAKSKGKLRVFGHKNGVKAVRETTEAAAELGIKYLTLYAFSTENWKRPELEVNMLMRLFVETMDRELARLNENNIKLVAIGDFSKLPAKTAQALQKGIDSTSQNTRMTLNLALNYSGRWEILNAVKKMASQEDLDLSNIDETTFVQYLTTQGIPDPELLIRTSGEQRISNFLLWQLSYSELYFTDTYWPDFDKEAFYKAIIDYQSRERRFGMVSEQLLT